MGIHERKLREKEALRTSVIEAATELFREVGYAGVSMRKIAKRIEYSVGTLYLYYKDKDELFFAVQQAAFREGLAYIQQIPEDATPIERLGAMGERYVRFGLENPDLYRLMFMLEGPMEALDEKDEWDPGVRLHNLLSNLVQECVTAGAIKTDQVDTLSFGLWSLVHGMVSLQISQRMHIYDGKGIVARVTSSEADRLIDQTYSLMMQMIQTR